MKQLRRPSHGFTLIELMITVAIVAILAAIALPAYLDSVKKGRRADARNQLLSAAQFMEKVHTENMNYQLKDAGGKLVKPTLPLSITTNFYDFSINSIGSQSFTLYAVPKGAQADDPCGTLTLDQAGGKDVTGKNTWTRDQCW